ncbi:unnamed protein product [Clonostachys byssicola]|uniref:Heterokaryon incompatibility domain-containing protein n=1 Tax=Clonostachys byssicola TaxID=160290 RepID=A0A9N9UN29_9HYPO|nr:unnamed protein product [Clonostachys byssicola]
MKSPKPFTYQPINDGSIRLVTIRPGPWDSTIECYVEVGNVKEHTRGLMALSYVWGDDSVRRAIRLNDCDFEVTVNLYEGLRQIRESMFVTETLPKLPIWVDAICINQEDIDEKAKQVPKMHQIYSTADEVLVWLGVMPIPPDFLKPWIDDEKYSWLGFDDEDCAMNEELREEALERYVLYTRSPKFPIQRLSRRPTGKPRKQQLIHFAVAAALRHCSYFQRLWTAQEAVLAKNGPVMLAGRHVLSWDEFTHKDRLEPEESVEIHGRPPTSFLGISSLRNQLVADYPREACWRLLDVIEDFSALACRDAVDKIYGLLAMVPLHNLPRELYPDYNRPCEEVYWKYAQFIFHSTGSLALLERYTEPLLGVPSWVPAIGLSEQNMEEGGSNAFPLFSANLREMSITGLDYGVCVDRLERPPTVSGPEDLHLVGTSEDLCDTMRQLAERILLNDGTKHRSRVWEWQIITRTGTSHPMYKFGSETPYNKDLFQLAQTMDLCEMQEFCSQGPGFEAYALAGWRDIAAFAWSSLLTSTGKMFTFHDYLWLDHLQPQKGDHIFKPNGMRSAVVLRPEADGKFRFLGRLTNSEGTLDPGAMPRRVTLV